MIMSLVITGLAFCTAYMVGHDRGTVKAYKEMEVARHDLWNR